MYSPTAKRAMASAKRKADPVTPRKNQPEPESAVDAKDYPKLAQAEMVDPEPPTPAPLIAAPKDADTPAAECAPAAPEPSTKRRAPPPKPIVPPHPLTDWSRIPFPSVPVEEEDVSDKPATPPKKMPPSPTRLTVPRRSPFVLRAGEKPLAMDNDFLRQFSTLGLYALPKHNRMVLANVFPMDIWEVILDFVEDPQNLYNLARTSSIFYSLATRRLYRSIAVRAPRALEEYGSMRAESRMITMDQLCIVYGGLSGKFGKHVKDLSLVKWTAPLTLPTAESSLSPIEYAKQVALTPMARLWRGAYGTNLTQLWLGNPDDINPPMIALNFLLAREITGQMPNLERFSYLPHKHHKKRPFVSAESFQIAHRFFMRRGVVGPFNTPVLTSVLLEAIKKMRRLKTLVIDFNDWDPLIHERLRTLSGAANTMPPLPVLIAAHPYSPQVDGLIGFERLQHLDFRGVSAHARFNEIARVVADCLKSGSLRSLHVAIEAWWYLDLQDTRQISKQKDLLDWAREIWTMCFRIAEIRRLKSDTPALPVHFKLTFQDVVWELTTWPVSYEFPTTNITSLTINKCPQPQIKGLLKVLSNKELPVLRHLSVEAALQLVHKLLRRTTGLRELYIFRPGLKELEQTRETYYLTNFFKPEGDTMLAPDMQLTSVAMDTIAKLHLRTLRVLVIDEMVYVPTPGPRSLLNSLATWRATGSHLRELGLSLWGPLELIETFIRSFPRLKCLWILNPQRPDTVIPVPGMPYILQYPTSGNSGGTSSGPKGVVFCNASNTAAWAAKALANELFSSGYTVPLDEEGEPVPGERWIAVGPHYINNYGEWRWLWKEDDAKRYQEYSTRMQEFGGPGGWAPLMKPKARVWEQDTTMFRALRKRRKLVDSHPYDAHVSYTKPRAG